MRSEKSKPLWEFDHPYYCQEGNFYARDCHQRYDSWTSFVSEEGDSDMDYNLLFRWDWITKGDKNELRLYFQGQRKALCRSVYVSVEKTNEPAIRKWLTERADHMRSIWSPLL